MNFKTIFYTFLLLIFFSNCQKEKELIECSDSSSTKHQKAVFLVMGQSNAANFGKTKYDANCFRLHNFYDGELFRLEDPLKGANGTGGSVWSRLGTLLMQNQFAEEIIFAPVAIGGVSLEEFLPGTALNASMLNAINKLNIDSHKITHILWHQGESNNTRLNSSLTDIENATLYTTQFIQLTNQIRALGIDAPIFISTATRCGNSSIDTALQQAQQNLQNDSLKIFNGPNTDLLGNKYRYDDCHFNDKGLAKHAEEWLNIILNY